jgi:hypothetical protein
MQLAAKRGECVFLLRQLIGQLDYAFELGLAVSHATSVCVGGSAGGGGELEAEQGIPESRISLGTSHDGSEFC